MKKAFKLEDLDCANCAAKMERAINEMPEIKKATVNFMMQKMTLELEEGQVMDEVLPSIRKHGAYMSEEVINKTLDDPDFIIEMATKLKYEREQRRLLEEKAKHLEATITIDKPYTNFGKSIATSSDAITIGQFAKVLNNNNINIGRNRLFTILRDNGYLIKVGKDKNMPKQIYVKQGLFKVAESIVKTVKGELLTATTLITGKGQMYFLEIFSNLTENKTYIS